MNDRESRKYSLQEFKKIHGETVRSSFVQVFKEPFVFVTFQGSDATIIYPLPDRHGDSRTSFGNSQDCDVSVFSEQVDPEHFHIFYHELLAAWCVEDRNSTTGTVLDGQKIAPFGVKSLNPESVITVGDVKIQIVPVHRVAELIFPHAGDSTINDGPEDNKPPKSPSHSQTIQSPHMSTTPIDETTGPVTRRMLRRKAKSQITDLSQLHRFLSVLSGDEAEQLLTLVTDVRYFERDNFAAENPSPILILLRVSMNVDKPPLYDFDDAPLECRLFWRLEQNDNGPELVFGRSRSCDIRLQAKVVSKIHGALKCIEGQWHLVDKGSVNRLYVNGKAVPERSEQALQDGDLIGVSPHVELQYLEPNSIYTLATRLQTQFDF